MSIKKELSYSNFDDLLKFANYDFKNINFNNPGICNTLLKLYDQANIYFSEGDDEKAFLQFMKFYEAFLSLKSSKLYKDDKNFVENLITKDKLNRTITVLENLKESLVVRYKERDLNKNLNSNKSQAESSNASQNETINDDIKSKLKKFLNPRELCHIIAKTDLKFLLIDIRSKNEFDYSHMNLNILLTENKKKQNLISYINIPPDLIENVAWKLTEKLMKHDKENQLSNKQLVSKVFSERGEYDYLILFDKDSTSASLKSDSKLNILKRAIFEYDVNDKLKNEPVILEGGWSNWSVYYPGFSTGSTNSFKDGTQLTVFPLNNTDDKEKALNSLKKTLNFDYPELIDFVKPTQPSKVSNTSSKNITINNTQNNTAQLNNSNSTSKFSNSNKVQIEIEATKLLNDKNQNDSENSNNINSEQKKSNVLNIPKINRSNKPPLASNITTSQPNDSVNSKISNSNNKIDNSLNNSSKSKFILEDVSSDESEIDEIKKNIANSSLSSRTSGQLSLIDQNQKNSQPTLPTKKTIVNNFSTNQSVISITHNENSENAVKNENGQFKDENLSKKILDTVYKPSRYKPIHTPLMKEGTSKILDPDTGLFKRLSSSSKSSSSTSSSKPISIEEKDESIPKQPSKISNQNFEDLKAKNETNDSINKSKSSLKRTYSSPNIANLNDLSQKDLDDNYVIDNVNNNNNNNNNFFKSSDNSKDKLEKTPNFNPSSLHSQIPSESPISSSKQFENRSSHINQNSQPTINRNNKPIATDKIVLSRIEELQPIYADIYPGLTGIRNLGNTCFMNSILQCLNSTQRLVEFFLSGNYKKDLNRTNELGFRGEIAEEFSIIVQANWGGHCKTIAPRRFKAIIGQFNQQFISNEQQDAQELLLFLLDGLHEDLNRVKKRPRILEKEDDNESLSDPDAANLAWSIHLSINNSIIVDLFQGQFKSSVACACCNKTSVKFDAFMYLTLPILSTKCNLYQCLDLFLKPESMSGESKWKCPRCKQYRDATKKIDIWKLPPLLIVHLKRFKYHGLWRDKITTNVDYPIENLNLDKYILNSESRRLAAHNYRLYAISNHSGTLDGGHYTALCRNFQLNRWFKYDDTEVKEVTDASSLKSPTSYILFYARI